MIEDIRQEINYAEMNRMLTDPNGKIMQDLLRRGLRVQGLARRKCPADTGRLRQSITVAPVSELGVTSIKIGTNVSYALAVHNGTGIHGPTSAPIRPHGRFLVFTVRGAARRDTAGRYIKGSRTERHIVFARQVSGQKGVPFLRDALREVVH
jgi:hypothetical protein